MMRGNGSPARGRCEAPRRNALAWCRRLRGPGGLSVADACVVSGVNFGTFVLLGRYAGAEELGLYALLFSVIVLLTTGQAALLATPYTVLRHRLTRTDTAGFAGSVVLQSAFLAAITLALGMMVATALAAAGRAEAHAVAVLAVILPGVLLRDLIRRVLFAMLRFGPVMTIDGLAGIARLGALAVLAASGSLDAITGLATLGLGDCLAALAGGAVLRRRLRVRPDRLLADLKTCWAFGRWSMWAQAIYTSQLYGAHWLLAAFKGPAWVGLYAACATLAQTVSPITAGIGNALGPVMADRLRAGGRPALAQVARRSTLVLVGTTGAYAVFLMWAGTWLLSGLLGSTYAAYNTVAVVLAIGGTVTAGGLAASKAVTVMERPQINLAINAIVMPITLILVASGSAWGGLLGAASGTTLGATLAMTLRWWWYRQSSVRLSVEKVEKRIQAQDGLAIERRDGRECDEGLAMP